MSVTPAHEMQNSKGKRTTIFQDLKNPHNPAPTPDTADLHFNTEKANNIGWEVPLSLKFDQCSNDLTRIGVLTTINEELNKAGIRATFTKDEESQEVSIQVLNSNAKITPDNGNSLPETFKKIVLDTCQKSFSVDNVSQNGHKVTFFQNENHVHFLDAPTYEQ